MLLEPSLFRLYANSVQQLNGVSFHLLLQNTYGNLNEMLMLSVIAFDPFVAKPSLLHAHSAPQDIQSHNSVLSLPCDK
ncbi:hypothetical protein T09_2470 [Trichinella sp. T9]|nr:hypothetical protein T09_2470 [Trichinella sp. T9]